MGAAWALTFHDLHPDAQQVMRACAVLDQSSISLVSAAAVVDVPVARMAATLAPAESLGWGRVTADRFDVTTAARSYLRDLARSIPEQDVRLMVDRLAAVVISTTTSGPTMTPAVREDVIGIVRAANRYSHPHVAVRVARAVWQALDKTSPVASDEKSVAVAEVDLGWCRQLAEHGEEACIALGGHEGLLELLDLSARAYFARGDWQDAEAAWLGALSIVDDLGDASRFVHFLDLLATNYRAWGRPHKTVDMLLEIASVQDREGDAFALAGTFAAVGTTFLQTDRVDDAEAYLRRADRLLSELPADDADVRARRAVVLCDLGRVHARRGAIDSARTAYHEALVLALDIGDDGLAYRIRALQAALSSA